MEAEGLEAFIPDRFTQKFGIIRNVPLSFSDGDIMEEIEDQNSLDVISVYRFQRNNEGGNFVSSLTIKVGFNAAALPKTVKMFGTLVSVEIYVPPLRQCKNCGRLGHIVIRCRGRKRCLDCGADIICPSGCSNFSCDFCVANSKSLKNCGKKICLSCKSSEHISSEHEKCPKWKSEKDIQEVMALSNISRNEVLKKYSMSEICGVTTKKNFT